MSEYKGIKGFQVQTRTEDPVPFAQAIADNPYQGSWSSGGALNTAKNSNSGAGTQTSGISMGGRTPGSIVIGEVELYNGSSWTETTDLNTARRMSSGAGASNTAALCYGGPSDTGSPYQGNQNAVESWNGSAWTEVAEMNSARGNASRGSTGASYTACFLNGGYGPSSALANMELWNGSAWTEVNDLNTARYDAGGFGSNTSALIFGGNDPSLTTAVESWDGSSFTEVAEYNSGAVAASEGAGGSNSEGLKFGGEASPGKVSSTEDWNGSSWTEVNDLASGRSTAAGSGQTATSALYSGGDPYQTTTEEWSFSGLQPTDPAAGYANAITGDFYYNSTTGQFKTINTGGAPIGTWASGGAMNTQGYQLYSLGTQTAAIRAGGYGGPPVGYQGNAEQYNGSSWTALSALNDSRSNEGGNGSGTVTAGLIYGGNTPPRTGNTESWNGSSWTEVNDLTTARSGLAGVGTSTASLAFLGQEAPGSGGYSTKVESWNGSSWTETTDANTARGGVVGIGQVYTAALAATGYSPSPPAPALVEDWNGSAWTEVSEVNTGRPNVASRSGTSTDGLIVSGGSRSVNCEHWNGSSWTEIANVATGRYGLGGQGSTANAAVAFGGNTAASDPAGVTTTEEFTAADFLIKSVTTS